jgi:hypothetical protein
MYFFISHMWNRFTIVSFIFWREWLFFRIMCCITKITYFVWNKYSWYFERIIMDDLNLKLFSFCWCKCPDQEPTTGWIPNALSESFEINELLSDGSHVRVWVRATDIMNNTLADYTEVHIDNTPPRVANDHLHVNIVNGTYEHTSRYCTNYSSLIRQCSCFIIRVVQIAPFTRLSCRLCNKLYKRLKVVQNVIFRYRTNNSIIKYNTIKYFSLKLGCNLLLQCLDCSKC